MNEEQKVMIVLLCVSVYAAKERKKMRREREEEEDMTTKQKNKIKEIMQETREGKHKMNIATGGSSASGMGATLSFMIAARQSGIWKHVKEIHGAGGGSCALWSVSEGGDLHHAMNGEKSERLEQTMQRLQMNNNESRTPKIENTPNATPEQETRSVAATLFAPLLWILRLFRKRSTPKETEPPRYNPRMVAVFGEAGERTPQMYAVEITEIRNHEKIWVYRRNGTHEELAFGKIATGEQVESAELGVLTRGTTEQEFCIGGDRRVTLKDNRRCDGPVTTAIQNCTVLIVVDGDMDSTDHRATPMGSTLKRLTAEKYLGAAYTLYGTTDNTKLTAQQTDEFIEKTGFGLFVAQGAATILVLRTPFGLHCGRGGTKEAAEEWRKGMYAAVSHVTEMLT